MLKQRNRGCVAAQTHSALQRRQLRLSGWLHPRNSAVRWCCYRQRQPVPTRAGKAAGETQMQQQPPQRRS